VNSVNKGGLRQSGFWQITTLPSFSRCKIPEDSGSASIANLEPGQKSGRGKLAILHPKMSLSVSSSTMAPADWKDL
jgi:hypothetical protein